MKKQTWVVAGGAIGTVLSLAMACSHMERVENRKTKFMDSFAEEASDWSSRGTNPYFVLEPGYSLVLAGKEDGKFTEITIAVLEETKIVDGVETRVVAERETVEGKLIEDTRDYFAISKKTNNVYYFGEEVNLYKNGKVVGHEGSWLSGIKGAKFGLMMPGKPLVGLRHYQEMAPGVGMDRAEIVSAEETFSCPAGTFQHCIKVEETTPLEKGAREYKIYAPGVGLVLDGDLKLTKYGFVKK